MPYRYRQDGCPEDQPGMVILSLGLRYDLSLCNTLHTIVLRKRFNVPQVLHKRISTRGYGIVPSVISSKRGKL